MAVEIDDIRSNSAPEPEQEPEPEPDDYRAMLENFDLTTEQKADLLASLWKLMNSFAALGFGEEPTQLVNPDIEKLNSQ